MKDGTKKMKELPCVREDLKITMKNNFRSQFFKTDLSFLRTVMYT